MAKTKKAKKAIAKGTSSQAAQKWPVFIDIPGHPELVERCDWDAVNNQPDCRIIPRVPSRGTRVRAAGPVRGVHRQHRAKRR
jgi:hypothetical protein